MITTQVCIICKIEKSLSEFYAHPQMKTGHLTKCINCCKKQAIERHKIKSQDPDWVEYEKTRGREKYHRYKYKSNPKLRAKWQSDYKSRFPEKKMATSASQHLKREKGNNLHHWSYNEQHCKDVIELSNRDHMKAHRFILYDQERMMYRRFDTLELLDTRESHESFIKDMIATKPD